jgi:transcriptional regulator with XRE-family HTH domain
MWHTLPMDGTESVSGSPVARNLRIAQTDSGLSNEALAAQVGVGLRLLQKWRAGEVEPRYENLVKLAAALDREVAWFYAPAEPDSGKAAA